MVSEWQAGEGNRASIGRHHTSSYEEVQKIYYYRVDEVRCMRSVLHCQNCE